MKRLSMQWRITLLTSLLIGATCIAMMLLMCFSGNHYMDAIGASIQDYTTDGTVAFDPDPGMHEELTIVILDAKEGFRATNWYITAAVTLLSGVMAYFVSGRALRPLRSFAAQVEKVQMNNLADMRINEDTLPEFRQLSRSFNQMLERLDSAFAAQKQFTGNAAHELRTPLALMQAKLELFSAEHPQMMPETAAFLSSLKEQMERLTQMTKTLLEMSSLQSLPRNEQIQLEPMMEEICADLAPLAEKQHMTLSHEGDGTMRGSDTLIYRLLYNLAENAVKYNRPGGSVRMTACQEGKTLMIRVQDTGRGIPAPYHQSVFQPFFRVDQSRSRACGGAGLGLSLAWEIVQLHGGTIRVEESSSEGTIMLVELPAESGSNSLADTESHDCNSLKKNLFKENDL